MQQSDSVPAILYHYTGVAAFRNVLESRTIRATRYDHMNDRAEVQLGVQRLLEAVRRHEANGAARDYKEFLIEAISAYSQGALEVYVLSLSEEPDSLEQWRAYTPFGGVAIGFDSQKVRQGFLCDITRRVGGLEVDNPIRPDLANRLMQCRYTDRHGQVDLGQLVAAKFFAENSYPALFNRQEALARQVFSATLSVAIYQTICCIKHGAYAHEREWRCVNYQPDQRDYPVGLSELHKRYIEMRIDPHQYIREVWVAPHGDQQSCERVIDYFAQKDGLHWRILRSTIPFRG